MRSVMFIMGVCLFLFIACTSDSQLAGNSSETINGIIIASGNHEITGKTRPSATVHVFSTDYWPHIETGSQKHSDFIYVNSQRAGIRGTFSFIDLRSGSYNLIVSDSLKSEYCYINELKVLTDTTIHYVSDNLFKSGSIRGTVQHINFKNKAVVFIPGTPYYVETNADGSFLIENVPRGSFSLFLDYFSLLDQQLTQNKVDQIIKKPDINPDRHIIEELGIIDVKSDSVSIYNKKY